MYILSFFSDSGAVAGVFLVVGMIIAAALAGGLFYMRRRRQRQRRFVSGVISRPLSYPDNPFEDPRDPPSPGYPTMRYASGSQPRASVVDRDPGHMQQNPFSDEANYLPTPPQLNVDNGNFGDEPMIALAMTGIGARRSSRLREDITPGGQAPGPSEQHLNASNEAPEGSHSRGVSTTQSSPSMYPPSLPLGSSEEQLPTPSSETATQEPLEIFAPQPIVLSEMAPAVIPAERRPPPVLPPRSPLRVARSPLLVRTDFTTKESVLIDPQPYEPLTPPESTSSHSAVPSDRTNSWTHNPFSECPVEVPAPVEVKQRDNFYTRWKAVQVCATQALSIAKMAKKGYHSIGQAPS